MNNPDLQQENIYQPSVKSSVFVGRDEYLQKFEHDFLFHPGSFILNIHTNGDGGVGKTQLLLQMLKLCRTQYSKAVITGEGLIDFYHTESRSIEGIISQLINAFDAVHFPKTDALLGKYHRTEDTSEPQYLLQRVLKALQEEYRKFADKIKQDKKIIVLFFDTYEVIQRADKEKKEAEPTEFSSWLEKELFPTLRWDNTRLVIAGRYPLVHAPEKYVVQKPLSLFEYDEAVHFLIECLNVAEFSQAEYQRFLGNHPQAKSFLEPFLYSLPNGRVGIWV
ncbi:MAG: ATP-binding protein [Candidatus Electrothrix sp. ATG2]|nr:ATP-binding protein [Candidatus Electrothrix sp. ATG2]